METRQHWGLFIRGWRTPMLALGTVALGWTPALLLVVLFIILVGDGPSWIATKYRIEGQEIIIDSGWFIVFRQYRIKKSRIESFELHRSPTGRVVGYGVVEIKGIGGSHYLLHYVPSPESWVEALR